MASPFLADIQAFSKKRLKKVQTKVITGDGQKLIESRDAQGNIIITTEDGKVVPSQSAPPDKVEAPKRTTSAQEEGGKGDEDGAGSQAGSNAIKSGLDRARLDRQASIDQLKSISSLKSKLSAFGGGGGGTTPKWGDRQTPPRDKPAGIPTGKSPSPERTTGPKDAASNHIGAQESSKVSAVKNKFVKQDKVVEEPLKQPVVKRASASPTKESTPSPKAQTPAPEPPISEETVKKGGKQCVEVMPGIIMGSRDLKERLPSMADMSVTHILNFLPRLTLDNSSLKEFIYKKVDIQDNPTTDIRQFFPECFEFIERAKNYKTENGASGKVALFCTENDHISSCIFLGYLMKMHGKKYKEALDYLVERRPNAKPGDNFLRRLKHYEKDLEEETMWSNLENEEDLEAIAKALESSDFEDDDQEDTKSKENKSGSANTGSSSQKAEKTQPLKPPPKSKDEQDNAANEKPAKPTPRVSNKLNVTPPPPPPKALSQPTNKEQSPKPKGFSAATKPKPNVSLPPPPPPPLASNNTKAKAQTQLANNAATNAKLTNSKLKNNGDNNINNVKNNDGKVGRIHTGLGLDKSGKKHRSPSSSSSSSTSSSSSSSSDSSTSPSSSTSTSSSSSKSTKNEKKSQK